GVGALVLSEAALITLWLVERSRRQKSERRALAKEALLAEVFRANPQPMALTTVTENRYVDVNDSFAELTGYLREDLLGRTPMELNFWSREKQAEFTERLVMKEARDVELRLRTRDGSVRDLRASAALVVMNAAPCALTTATDVTGQRLQNRRRYFFNLPM